MGGGLGAHCLVKKRLPIIFEDMPKQALKKLLSCAGFSGEPSLLPLTGGANNQVFRVETDGHCALLKAYFRHPDDPRDRLGAEFAFCSFAWENGIRALPQPLACDRDNCLGLYEFVDGERVLPQQITEEAVNQALGFFRKLNRHRGLPEARRLPEASEACFAIAEHLRCVERRVARLIGQGGSEGVEGKAASFVHNELRPAWERTADSVRGRVAELGLALDAAIPEKDRCLSPSDFGFHNALRAPDGRLRFLDFEYAGWDDPAKMVCDFFCQPALPVPRTYYDMFMSQVAADLSDPQVHLRRFALLLPVYQIKWVCILLNEFLPAGKARRRFAGGGAALRQRKARQLEKARLALQQLVE